ncbi:hypothetical protein EV383_3917 [Pseudonocardia sediminis]|uniref:Transcriptional regulator, AbiEi antitoxin, Type IV TA system n=1 Tax=Pseudonocardia sediminis TaxID=1397368 RepID=A0A4Q7UY80_PSEST|nr:hypothetical protein [Pseudonocardia sediminis]RZT87012.1 hypothetical protein EV383_3917 [Pseudonocardia sediminis]
MTRSVARSSYLAAQFPDGVASRAQLLALGISSSTIAQRCRSGGPWKNLLLGQVQLDGRRTGPRQYRRAALLHAGPGAILTGVGGAGLHGVTALPRNGTVHVLVPGDRRVTSRDFVVVTRTSRMPEPVELAGFPVAPMARCLVDAAARTDDADTVRAMLADAVQKGLLRLDDLTDELSEPRRPRTALVRGVTAEILDGVRSAAEAWVRDLVLRSGLPSPAWNVALHARDGRRLGVVDAYWEDVGLAWEIQSLAFHLGPRELARDVEKVGMLASAGVLVLPTMASRLWSDRPAAMAELVDAHARAGAMPAPAVTAGLWRP